MSAVRWRAAQAEKLAAMTPAERVEYDQAAADMELRLHLAELVYDARIAAGLTQAELAQRMGTRQPVISQIENGEQVPTVAMLDRVARATGKTLRISLARAS